MIHRRQFVSNASKLAVGAAVLPSLCEAAPKVKERFKIALSQYSLRAMFKDGSLDPLDFPKFTADTFGIKAIDLWVGDQKPRQQQLGRMAGAVLQRGIGSKQAQPALKAWQKKYSPPKTP